MSLPIPKYTLGSSTPNGVLHVVRARSPYLIARAEPAGLHGWQLTVWPAAVAQDLAPAKLAKIGSQMADLIAAELDGDRQPGTPHRLALASDTPPEWLVCDNSRSQFTGVLHTQAPRFWLVLHDGGTGTLVPDPADPMPPEQAARWARLAGDHYTQFAAAEDALP